LTPDGDGEAWRAADAMTGEGEGDWEFVRLDVAAWLGCTLPQAEASIEQIVASASACRVIPTAIV
jgi:hypothetical protein